MAHVLDNPVWNALNGRQSGIALGQGLARRYLHDISPWAAIAEPSPEALADLAPLVPVGGSVIVALNNDETLAPTPELAVTSFQGVQMVAKNVASPAPSDEVIDLTDDDAADMLELATLTKPGPFIARTHSLGQFVGIRKEGKLVAMVGERFKLDGYTEVSGVCTHPDWRGRGYAGLLSRIVTQRIAARGEIAMLHAFITNTAAIKLYEELGFETRVIMQGAVYRRN
jgi:ribosomal protein S18 acetylase RimI-like enzyme